MKTIEDIFKGNACIFDQDSFFVAVENVLNNSDDLIETAIGNLDVTFGLGEGYAKRNPVLLAGVVQAIILDHNMKHLINTLQVSCAVQHDTMQKNHDAMLEELRAIRGSHKK